MYDPWIGLAESCGHSETVEEVTWLCYDGCHTTDRFVHKYLRNLVAVNLVAGSGDAVYRHIARSQVGVCYGTCLVSGKLCSATY
jgi:hypothetical protein